MTFKPQDQTFEAGHRIGVILQGSNTVWAIPDDPGATYTVTRSALELPLAQLDPPDLAGERLRQVVHELDLARIRVGGVALAHVALDLVGQLVARLVRRSASTMNALTMSPRRSSGEATAAASFTAGCSTHADSTSNGPIR